MSSSYRVLKLQSGEEIIAKIKGKDGEKIILENPMIFTTQIRSNHFGQTQEITFLKDWLSNINKDTVKIPENFIVTWNSPSSDVTKLYEAERRLKSDKDFRKAKGHTASNKNPISGSNQASLEKILEDLKKLEESIDENTPQAPKGFTPPIPPGFPKNSVFMNMILPPDFLKELIDEGYFDMEGMPGMMHPDDEDMIGNFYEEINDHEYTGEETNDPDYGNRWTDWNPDPLSDEYGDESL